MTTTAIQWGATVSVRAVTMRVLGYRDGETARYKIPQANDLPWFEALCEGDWPGEPIELDWDLPKGPRFLLEPTLNGRSMVRYRRFALSPSQTGIRIGETWRWEGALQDGQPGSRPPGGGMGGPRRNVGFYEVALPPQVRSSKALVVFVHPHDIDVVDNAPAAVASPRARSGRLGGGSA